MRPKTYPVAIAGVGKIARDQHIPSIANSDRFELAATISRHASVDGVDHYTAIEDFLAARPDIRVVALCVPPQARFKMAWSALQAGRHVLLEKPPGATISEVRSLSELAKDSGLTLFATWHSRFASAVSPARQWLAERTLRRVEVVWKEDVRRWHPGQAWIWKPGGVGVFDPGINALSILTEIMPHALHLTEAELVFPANRGTPIAASLTFTDPDDTAITAEFDWRQTGPQTWDITVETVDGVLRLGSGGATMAIDGKTVETAEAQEYPLIYSRMAELIDEGRSDVDLAPLVHVADAFMLGRRVTAEPFND